MSLAFMGHNSDLTLFHILYNFTTPAFFSPHKLENIFSEKYKVFFLMNRKCKVEKGDIVLISMKF